MRYYVRGCWKLTFVPNVLLKNKVRFYWVLPVCQQLSDIIMECISKRSSGSEDDGDGRFRISFRGRRSSVPPPLPPKPSAPPANYPPQVPYYHPPTIEHLNYQNQMHVLPYHFYPEDEFYPISPVVYNVVDDFRPPLPAEALAILKPTQSPIPQPRRRRTSLPRIQHENLPIFFRLQTSTAEFQSYREAPISRRSSVSKIE